MSDAAGSPPRTSRVGRVLRRLFALLGAAIVLALTVGVVLGWFGHSSMLVEIDGHRVLTDPVWSERASPIPGVGPRAWYAPPRALADLPPIESW